MGNAYRPYQSDVQEPICKTVGAVNYPRNFQLRLRTASIAAPVRHVSNCDSFNAFIYRKIFRPALDAFQKVLNLSFTPTGFWWQYAQKKLGNKEIVTL